MPASRPFLEVTQHRAGSQRALAEGSSHACVRIGDDVSGGKDGGPGRAQLAIDDDRPRPVEVELAGHDPGARHASDLHHDTSGLRSHPFPGGLLQGDLLEVFAAVHRLELPTAEVLDALLAASLLAATGGLPNTIFRQTNLSLFAKYEIDKKSALRVNLVYQRSTVNDWGWGYNGTPFSYSDATTLYQQPNQNVGLIGVTYIYKF